MTFGAKELNGSYRQAWKDRSQKTTNDKGIFTPPTFDNFDNFDSFQLSQPTFDSLVQLPSGYLGAAGVLPLIVSSAVWLNCSW